MPKKSAVANAKPDARIANHTAEITSEIAKRTDLAAWCRIEAERRSTEMLIQARQHQQRIDELKQMQAEWSDPKPAN
jgi:hypothetical protein